MKDLERYIAKEHIKQMREQANRFATREQIRRKKRIRRNLGAAAILMGFLLIAVLLCLTASVAFSGEEHNLPTEDESVEFGPVYEAIEEPAEPDIYHEEAMSFYPVPLDHDVQAHIIHTCRSYDIDPVIVVGIIGVESSYNHSAVGDSGDSLGLMQIQEKWHRERMDRLGVTDLLDPIQNVSVGIDYIAELLEKHSLEHALTAYNSGSPGASAYATKVMERMDEVNENVCM